MMTKNYKSVLFSNIVMHQRLIPLKHRFQYSLISLYLNYDELKSLEKKISFFSYNKFNIFSFYEKDHGYRNNSSLKEFVTDGATVNKKYALSKVHKQVQEEHILSDFLT